MWALKDIWSGVRLDGYKEICFNEQVLVARQLFNQGMPYCIIRNEANSPGHAVIFMHGFSDNALLGLSTALELAQHGFTALLPEAKWHGLVQPENFAHIFNSDNFLMSMKQTLKSTMTHLTTLLTYVQSKRWALPGVAGIAGFSMGAYMTYMMPLLDNRFTVAGPVSGSPDHYDAKAVEHFNIKLTITESALQLPEASQATQELSNVAWLIQNAKDDETVSVAGSERFYEKLMPYFSQNPEKIKAIFYPSGGHLYTEIMREELVKWFVHHLQ